MLAAQRPTTVTDNCQGCHTATSTPFTAAAQVHSAIPQGQTSACANCHDPNNASLIGSASNFSAPSADCQECHTNYFNAHRHGSSTAITHCLISEPARDISAGEGCGLRCHSGQVESWEAIKSRHSAGSGGLCGTCHNSTRANGAIISVNPAYGSIAAAIAQAGATNALTLTCIDCHADKGTTHVVDHSKFVAGGATTCVTNCHTATFVNDSIDPKVHDSCTTCHNATIAPVTLKESAIGHAQRRRQLPGVSHVSYFDQHLHSHDLSHAPSTDLSQAAPGAACRNCHDDAGLGKGSAALSTWNAIGLEHDLAGT